MRRLYILLLALVCCWCAKAHEHYIVQHYSIKDGLSQNAVMAILQDRQGFMWFGTWDGLNRFDGYSFRVFKAMKDGELAVAATPVCPAPMVTAGPSLAT